MGSSLEELEMLFSDRNRYVQIYQENDVCNIYYDRNEQIYLNYKKDNTVKFSLKYQMGILVTLYLGQTINKLCYDVLKESEWLKDFLIVLVLALGFFGLYFIEEYVAKNIKKEGRYAKNVISSAELKIGKEQFKKQRFIIYMCVMASAVLCLLFEVTNNIVFWILFFVSWLCFIGIIASVRPCLKKKMLNFLNEKQNLQNTGARF